ncbi:MAG: BNR-4 repeat-containing protein [Kiritimatiellia bacterium]|nr:BNR-4 repeat-containing protein [Kiritimatiellia bacterium]MDP6848978.1 BNR-4 repeat-containing protein [Kiritimatiellia bacterium]
MNKLIAITSISLLASSCRPHTQMVSQERDPPAQPGESYANLSDDGAWCWFADPRAIYHEGRHKRTYVGYVTGPEGTVIVSAFDHATKQVCSATLRTFKRNDHLNPVLLFRPDGRLMIFYCDQRGKDMYYRSTKNPEDITSWSDEKTIGVNTPGKANSYPNPIILKEENDRIYLIWRGGNRQFCYTISDDGIKWSPAREFVKGGRAPYVKIYSSGRDRIHLAFSNDHPEYDANSNIYYACYRNGRFFRADGTRIESVSNPPLTDSEAELVYHSSLSGRAYYTGGIALDHDDPSIVYLSKPTSGVFEIEKWVRNDADDSWSHRFVTAGSTRNNVRPFVPYGKSSDSIELIWMCGDYVSFTDFQTELKMR